jgi:hypothetical protein
VVCYVAADTLAMYECEDHYSKCFLEAGDIVANCFGNAENKYARIPNGRIPSPLVPSSWIWFTLLFFYQMLPHVYECQFNTNQGGVLE